MEKDEAYYFHQTPSELCKILIEQVPLIEGDKVLEPFKGEGNFYNNFPNHVEKDWCEIIEGRDYKDYDKEIDWVISNPPFRINNGIKRENLFWKILNHYSQKVKKGIAFLVNDNCFATLTPRRLKELNEHGLFIHSISCCAIKKWRGRYFWIIFQKEPCDFYRYIHGNY